jgi:hypothetical protein
MFYTRAYLKGEGGKRQVYSISIRFEVPIYRKQVRFLKDAQAIRIKKGRLTSPSLSNSDYVASVCCRGIR